MGGRRTRGADARAPHRLAPVGEVHFAFDVSAAIVPGWDKGDLLQSRESG